MVLTCVLSGGRKPLSARRKAEHSRSRGFRLILTVLHIQKPHQRPISIEKIRDLRDVPFPPPYELDLVGGGEDMVIQSADEGGRCPSHFVCIIPYAVKLVKYIPDIYLVVSRPLIDEIVVGVKLMPPSIVVACC